MVNYHILGNHPYMYYYMYLVHRYRCIVYKECGVSLYCDVCV